MTRHTRPLCGSACPPLAAALLLLAAACTSGKDDVVVDTSSDPDTTETAEAGDTAAEEAGEEAVEALDTTLDEGGAEEDSVAEIAEPDGLDAPSDPDAAEDPAAEDVRAEDVRAEDPAAEDIRAEDVRAEDAAADPDASDRTEEAADARIDEAPPEESPPTYSIGGNVTGLLGSGLVLQNNSGDNLSVTADGAFTFVTRLLSGAPYSVTVLAHPASPWQSCAVTGGSGNVGSTNVTTVAVACALVPDHNWDFELTAPGEDPPAGFRKTEGPTIFNAVNETTTVNDGVHACGFRYLVDSTTTREMMPYSVVSGAPGVEYTVHLWINDNNTLVRARPFLRFFDATLGTVTSSYPSVYSVDSPGWFEYVESASDTTAGITYVQGGVRAYKQATIPAEGTLIYLDDYDITGHVAFAATDGTLDILPGKPTSPPTLATTPTSLRAALSDQGTFYVAATPAVGTGTDRMVFVWIGEVDTTATWPIPWAKAGTVPRPVGTGLLFALIQKGASVDPYCEWRVATSSTDFTLVGTPIATCSAAIGAVLEGSMNLTTVAGGWTLPRNVPARFSFSSIGVPRADGSALDTATQTPACATCDNKVDAAEILGKHRARLLVGRLVL